MQTVRPMAMIDALVRVPNQTHENGRDDQAAFDDAMSKISSHADRPDSVEKPECLVEPQQTTDMPETSAWAMLVEPPVANPITPHAGSMATDATQAIQEPVALASPQVRDAVGRALATTPAEAAIAGLHGLSPTPRTPQNAPLPPPDTESTQRAQTPAAAPHTPMANPISESATAPIAGTVGTTEATSATGSIAPQTPPPKALAQSLQAGVATPAISAGQPERPLKPVLELRTGAADLAARDPALKETVTPNPLLSSPAETQTAPQPLQSVAPNAPPTVSRANANVKSPHAARVDGPLIQTGPIRNTDAPSPAANAAALTSIVSHGVLMPMASEDLIAPIASSATNTSPTPALGAVQQATSQPAHATLSAPGGPGKALAAHQQIAQQIVRQVSDHGAQFTMRLDPPALGRVDVRLSVGHDRSVSAIISADQPATLTELARASRDLERLLEQSGLAVANDGLQFSLRQDGGNSRGKGTSDLGGAPYSTNDEAAQVSVAPISSRPFGLENWRVGRVDLVA